VTKKNKKLLEIAIFKSYLFLKGKYDIISRDRINGCNILKLNYIKNNES